MNWSLKVSMKSFQSIQGQKKLAIFRFTCSHTYNILFHKALIISAVPYLVSPTFSDILIRITQKNIPTEILCTLMIPTSFHLNTGFWSNDSHCEKFRFFWFLITSSILFYMVSIRVKKGESKALLLSFKITTTICFVTSSNRYL